MGEITGLIQNGTLCQVCGCLMKDLIPVDGEALFDPPGYPRTCDDCK